MQAEVAPVARGSESEREEDEHFTDELDPGEALTDYEAESEDGWKPLKKSEKSAKHYETLCKECLVNITDRLIEEVQGNPRDKVA